jgi:hypothetical protein
MRSPSLFQSSGLTAFARPKAADLNKISLSAKEKEAGHYSGLNENWRSETFDAGRSLSFAHVQLHFGVQQRCQNNTILALGLSPIVGYKRENLENARFVAGSAVCAAASIFDGQ